LLLEHGFPVDVRDRKGRTALMHAAVDNNRAMAQVRVCARARACACACACACASVRVMMNTRCLLVQLLLEAGADVEAEDLASCTPLKYAAAAVALETGQLLISRVRTDSPHGLLSPRELNAVCRAPCAVCRVCA